MDYPIHILNELNNYEIITESGCHIFMGSLKEANSYGRIWYNGHHKRMHRLAYEFYKEKIPAGLQVLHTCDVKCCTNTRYV